MNRLIGPILLSLAVAGPSLGADGPMAEPAARAWAIADVVMARHVDPPTRSQMLLAGIKAMAASARVATPADLPRRVSDLATPDHLASLLAEVPTWPKVEAPPPAPGKPPGGPGVAGWDSPQEALFGGLLGAVPGETMLMSEKERKVQESFEANLYVGVQVQLGLDEATKRPVFIKVLEGGPAENAGARDGDLIEEVAGISTTGMSLARAVDLLRGAEGTDVRVGLKRPSTGEAFARTMTRGRLPRASVGGLSPLPDKRWKVRIDGPAPIGYLKVTDVTGSTPQELRVFAEKLESEGVRALVLDLRKTSPARFHQTVLLADALLDGGVIGRVRSPQGVATYRAGPDALFRGWPIVVLAGGNTSPEVAWLCDALRDNRRAMILGATACRSDPAIAEVVPVPGGEWSVRLTTGRLERGDGRPLTGSGPKGPVVDPGR